MFGCRLFLYQAADLDDHPEECGAHRLLRNPEMLRRLLASDPESAVEVETSVVGDATEVDPTVGDVTPPWGNANQLLDHITELIAHHGYTDRRQMGYCSSSCTGCAYTAFREGYVDSRQLHAAHVAELVMDMLQAEQRITNTGKTAQ